MSKRRCIATGKTIFDTKGEAKESMIKFKSFSKMTINGRRIKHRVGKPEQTRVYYCEHCKGFHLTKWSSFNERYNKAG